MAGEVKQHGTGIAAPQPLEGAVDGIPLGRTIQAAESRLPEPLHRGRSLLPAAKQQGKDPLRRRQRPRLLLVQDRLPRGIAIGEKDGPRHPGRQQAGDVMDIPLDGDLVIVRLRPAPHDQRLEPAAAGPHRAPEQRGQHERDQRGQQRPENKEETAASHSACFQ